jgi:hypothetical protein
MMFARRVFLRECPGCHGPIVLPRQSPLGIYEGQSYRPTDRRPARFLCIRDGQVREMWVTEFRLEDYTGLDQELAALWDVVCVCARKNCERPHTIYTMCSPRADVATVRDAVYKTNLSFACGDHWLQKGKNRIHPKKLD